MNYLLSGRVPGRLGTAHPNTVPYQVFPSSDGYYILGANNDHQFRRYCGFAGMPELAADPRFATNAARVANRDELVRMISDVSRKQPTHYWLEGLGRMGLPCGPVNTIDQVFADPQVNHRNMKITMSRPPDQGGTFPLIGNPLKLSETPVTYRLPPPRLGEHTDEVLEELLGLTASDRDGLRRRGVI
jgi:crotonobetainyl-CoA:carnitine CoA-transferase CaiB-like acyl-CoA transferase